MWDATRLSLQVLAVSVPVIFVLGIAFAMLFARATFRGRVVAETVVMLPLVLPPSVVGYGLLRGLGRGGPLFEWFGINLLFTWHAAAIASAVVGLPLMVQAAKVGFLGVDPLIEDAARVDGAHRWQVYGSITLPLARRGILVGLLLGSVRALGEFGATLAIAGSIPGRTQTMPLAIYDAMQRFDYALANQITVLMIALGYGTIWLTQRLSTDRDTR
ncbi:MAG TPA: molybdate ABC transporter permease subunit [Thermomicrobiales bacterium]|nr:molybdate ABC transporter permease subunit [Thermomicrobiales bacterium]